jgi:peptide chain release factor subunit 1
MTRTISIDALRELAAFRAERGCAISLFLDLDPSISPTAGDVAARVRSLLSEGQRRLRSDLGHEEREGLRADLRRMERFFESEFDRDGAVGFALFVAGPDDVWQTMPLAGRVHDGLKIGTEFYLAPLVPLLGRGEGALVVAVNRERGSLYRLRDGRLTDLADLTEDAPTRHDQGGWSQARFQRHVDELAQDHYRTVAEELERRFRRLGRPRIVVVATAETRADFQDALSGELADAVIGWAHAEAHATATRLEAIVRPVLERWLADRESEAIERWREEIGRGSRATAGWADTLEAASDGRVELLLSGEGARHEAVRCPHCGRVQAAGETCPLDGERLLHTPDGLDLAVRQTLAHGGSVWVVRHRQDLEPVGGIGAVLRF